ncbi:BlaI/MecI/CopY family transcriptional regulator [Iamia majanohamensis]|uniref:BlaI/MecI/CopY family transcriptional regulator n=1 Tax=Iamia majanohamensis TaxID=467976 RepID=A0AAF0BWP2_9ACTN|nr:BlaI/MecI/CopY family transcriptional regulator [Iamia majanohamensis]WCO68035.1 BlaI/MecI/CopY family transcriptional regulator [Iamia majanohamensis]
MAERRPTGTLERAVLECVWAAPDGATPGDVRAALGEDLAYTTVMTILRRLWQKDLLTREKRGRAHLYRAKVSEAEFAASGMHRALSTATDGPAALSRFVGGLSEEDERALRQILEELDG